MKINHVLPLQRLIGKIDNDFNIDQSDWIPRVAAWTVDALSQLKCTPYTRIKKKYCTDDEGFIRLDNVVDIQSIKVYSTTGCEIKNLSGSNFLHTPYKQLNKIYNDTSAIDGGRWTDEEIAVFIGDNDAARRMMIGRVCADNRYNFVIVGDDKLQANVSNTNLIVDYVTVATYYDEYFNDQVPFVYDNGDLLEALAWYCLMKILQRGYKHQVFSLTGQEPVNPYVQWNKIKDKATASVRHDLFDASKNTGWNNFFYNSTFLPRG